MISRLRHSRWSTALLRLLLSAILFNAATASAVECPSMALNAEADCHTMAAPAGADAHAGHQAMDEHAGHGSQSAAVDHSQHGSDGAECTCCQLCTNDQVASLVTVAVVLGSAEDATVYLRSAHRAVTLRTHYRLPPNRGPPLARSV